MKEKITVVAVDDHPVAQLAVKEALSGHIDLHLVAQHDGPRPLMTWLAHASCDILITDLSMPGEPRLDGLSLLRRLRESHPDIRVVVLSMYDNAALIGSALRAGALGFVSKRDAAACLVSAVRAAMRRERYLAPAVRSVYEAAQKRSPAYGTAGGRLTECESLVLHRYLEGVSMPAIAEGLGRSVKTVSAQRASAMRKLGIDNDAHLFELAAFDGLDRVACPPTYGIG